MSLLLIFIFSYIAFVLSALCGGGAGLILIPVLGRLLPVSHIPVALSIGTFTSSATRVFAFFRSINWHIVKYFLPAALPAVMLGAYLLKFVNPVYLEILMAVFLISNLPLIFRKEKDLQTPHLASNGTLVVIGFCAGFLSGFTGAIGLLFNRFYLRYGLTKEQIVATRSANEIILHLIKIILYSLLGLISAKAISVGLIVALSALLSTITMKWILPVLSESIFKRTGYLAMVLSGIIMLSQAVGNILFTNDGSLAAKPVAKGIETQLQWKKASYSLEFTYDEGFEFEQIIPLSELNTSQQERVKKEEVDHDKLIIEIVYTLDSSFYEAYYFRENKLLKKVEFK